MKIGGGFPGPLHIAIRQIIEHNRKLGLLSVPKSEFLSVIPIAARIMAVSDVYDALISRRVYKPPFPHEKAVTIIQEGKGSHFDPDMVDAFLENSDGFYSIAQKYADFKKDIKTKAESL